MNITLIFKYIEIFIIVYLGLAVFYTFLLSLFGFLFYKDKSGGILDPKQKIAIIIPAYKEDSIIINTLEEHLSLNYPTNLYHVFLCADSFQEETLEKIRTTFSSLPVTLVEVKFDISTVTKSVKEGVARLDPKEYPITLICDADNVLEKDFLIKINSAFQKGMKAVQGRRFTKNMNTPMAVLDSISEMINNHIARKGNYALGLSSSLIGSGMAFDTALLQECLLENHSIGGYDRELQLSFSDRNVRIHYVVSAICYDEKISTSKAFGNQRKRWLSSQFMDLRDHFGDCFSKLIFRGNINYFNLGFLNNFFLSRVLNLGLLFIFSFISLLLYFITKGSVFLNPIYWIALFLIYLISLGLGIPRKFLNANLFKALVFLPGTFIQMFSLLFKLKGANKRFIHTEHHVLGVDKSVLDKN